MKIIPHLIFLTLLAGCISHSVTTEKSIAPKSITLDIEKRGDRLREVTQLPECRFYRVNADLIRKLYGNDGNIPAFFGKGNWANEQRIMDWVEESHILIRAGTKQQLDFWDKGFEKIPEYIRRI